jgi:hypothetical protein
VPTQRELETLVRKLDRKILVTWVEEMYFGKPAYDHLVARLRGTELTRHQRANALHALFRLRAHGSDMEVFALLRAHASDGEIRVRTAAVNLLIGMMRLHNLQPPFELSACIGEIRVGLALGLFPDKASFAKSFIEEHEIR